MAADEEARRGPAAANGEPQPHQFTAVNQAPPAGAAPSAAAANGAERSSSGSVSPSDANGHTNGKIPGTSVFGMTAPRPVPSMGPQATAGSSSPAASAAGAARGAQPYPFSVPQGERWQQQPPPPQQQQQQQQQRDGSEDSSVQKRKRAEEDDEKPRPVSPTTQTQRHHLAAHEAANNRQQQPGASDDHALGYPRRTTGTLEDDGDEQQTPGQPEKRRKRQFTNRTKTGCITCRRRKKKCDEGKPDCNNCTRGGFVCEGYNGKVSWTKPPGKTASTTTTLIRSGYDQQPADPYSSSTSTPVHSRVLPMQSHRPGIDEHHPALSQSPAGESPAARHQNFPPHPHPAFAPPPHAAAPGAASAGLDRLSLVPQQQPQIALMGPDGPRTRTEKDKMLGGDNFQANDKDLVKERRTCQRNCYTYNQIASNPLADISEAEQFRMLLEVLRPGLGWRLISSGSTGSGSFNFISPNGYPCDIKDVVVEAPFNCTYGYNIFLYPGVTIGPGCTIQDSCKVTIHPRTILSDGVKIYTATHPIDPRVRSTAMGQQMAKPVTIEEECWIGGNAIILPGITIGKGSVIGAGSVVTKNVPAYTVVGGNPARVLRGIYSTPGGDA